MNSALNRLNALATLALMTLGVLCGAASFLDVFNSPSVRANVEVVKVIRFRRQLTGNEEVNLTLNMSVDLQSAFTWNTKQVFVFIAAEYETEKNSLNQISLWDYIIPTKDEARFEKKVKSKYLLIDQGSNLRGKRVDLVLHWHAMPITGRMILGNIAVSSFQLPNAYT
ncbi:signal peptidase complex subunit 3A-like [Wolffia australiana]